MFKNMLTNNLEHCSKEQIKNIKSRNAIICNRCALDKCSGSVNFQLQTAFLDRVLAVLLKYIFICTTSVYEGGGGKHPNIKTNRVNRAVWGRFGYFRPTDRVRHAALNIFHRSNRKSVGWEPSFGPNTFFLLR